MYMKESIQSNQFNQSIPMMLISQNWINPMQCELRAINPLIPAISGGYSPPATAPHSNRIESTASISCHVISRLVPFQSTILGLVISGPVSQSVYLSCYGDSSFDSTKYMQPWKSPCGATNPQPPVELQGVHAPPCLSNSGQSPILVSNSFSAAYVSLSLSRSAFCPHLGILLWGHAVCQEADCLLHSYVPVRLSGIVTVTVTANSCGLSFVRMGLGRARGVSFAAGDKIDGNGSSYGYMNKECL